MKRIKNSVLKRALCQFAAVTVASEVAVSVVYTCIGKYDIKNILCPNKNNYGLLHFVDFVDGLQLMEQKNKNKMDIKFFQIDE